MSQVVHDYGDICQTIIEMAVETNAPISADDFGTLNRCLDDAIAGAVTSYQRESQQSRLDDAAARGNERMGFLVHELRNLVHTAMVAFDVLKTGNVGISGSTGAVLNRSLDGLRHLIARSIDEVRSASSVRRRKPVLVSELIEEIGGGSHIGCRARGITLVVPPVQEGLVVEADRQILSAVISKSAAERLQVHPGPQYRDVEGRRQRRTCARSRSRTNAVASRGRMSNELPPSFEQRGADRTGLGIGLAFCRWGAEANGGRLYARNMPEIGCVFTVDLPRSHPPATPA